MRRINLRIDRANDERRSSCASTLGRLALGWILGLVVLRGAPLAADDAADQTYQRWARKHVVTPPAEGAEDREFFELQVPPAVFAVARFDLGDLRLVDANGQEIPYALRVRRAEWRDAAVPARQFNEAVAEGGVVELSFDLGESPPEHNQVEVDLAGENFRRLGVVFGSDDGKEWLKLATRQLLRFQVQEPGQHDLEVRRLRYAPARYRYLRLRVERDPLVDREPAVVNSVHVHRRAETPGEFTSLAAPIDYQESTRAADAPATSWTLNLPYRNLPVEKVRVKFAEPEFARNYEVLASDSTTGSSPLEFAGAGEWRRKPGEGGEWREAEFSERPVSRLRLLVVDHGNPPLTLEAVEIVAPARQLVFARRPELAAPFTLYFGNLLADPPQYDLQRTLPAEFARPPLRLETGESLENPRYVPAPLPVTERAPWLIYVVLTSASAVVGAILWDVGRRAIARHESAKADAAAGA